MHANVHDKVKVAMIIKVSTTKQGEEKAIESKPERGRARERAERRGVGKEREKGGQKLPVSVRVIRDVAMVSVVTLQIHVQCTSLGFPNFRRRPSDKASSCANCKLVRIHFLNSIIAKTDGFLMNILGLSLKVRNKARTPRPFEL